MTHPLTRAREARGWSRPQLARQLQNLGAQRGAAVGTGKDGVLRWEVPDRLTGKTREPDPPTKRLIAELLAIPRDAVDRYPWPVWVDLDPLQQPDRHNWDAPGAIQALAGVSEREMTLMDINRRTFTTLTGVALTTSLWEWITADPAAAGQITHARRLGESSVAHVEERVRQLRATDDADGGGMLLTETASALTLVTGLLRDRSYSDEHGARLHAAAADLTRLHAWARFDTRDECADVVFDAALRAAHAAGDQPLGAHILAFWSIAANNTGRHADAEEMAAAALAAARGRSTHRVVSMLLSRRARARAQQHDERALADLDRAGELLERAEHRQGQQADPEWVYWFDRAELLGALASTHLDLQQPDRAEQQFAETAALFPADRIRTQALFLVRRADAQWRQGEAERACSTAHQALDLTEGISSHRSVEPLRMLADHMNGRVDVPAVRDLTERVAAVA